MQSTRGAHRLQPYVLCLGGTKLEPRQAFAIIEGKVVETKTLTDAVDLCFKACYAYNLEYGALLRSLGIYSEHCV